jgi:hypothetical protein
MLIRARRPPRWIGFVAGVGSLIYGYQRVEVPCEMSKNAGVVSTVDGKE